MRLSLQRLAPWLLAWLALTLVGALVLARAELSALRATFETDARIAHRLLSQQVVQHDAVLATLALLGGSSAEARPEERLPSVYPQILSVQRRERGGIWIDARIHALEAQSRHLNRAVLGEVDQSRGRYQLVLGAEPVSYLLLIDIRSMVPWSEWPMAPDASPVRVTLDHAGQPFVLQAGDGASARASGWHFEFQKTLAAESQPLLVNAQRHVGWGELPWRWIVGWTLGIALLLKGTRALLRQRQERLRAQELLRLGQVARLNTLGELAAGMAHELNQPLTAVLANTQAASRLLGDESPDLTTVRQAMTQAVNQARRASEVVGRLRRAVERPDLGDQLKPVNMEEAARKALYLLEPEFRRHEVTPTVEMSGPAFRVLAEPVALEQIIHNLLMNALQALNTVPACERRLNLTLDSAGAQGRLTLRDSGSGISAEVLPRIFEPFFTTRDGGLGLGLSLCETLASGMGGSLTAANQSSRGAEFCLTLPLAPPLPSAAP